MANNERVSQLIGLSASDLQTEDILLITDMSQKESKKLELGQMLLFIESSGSFIAYTSLQADTASYISVNNIDGIVPVALVASQSISASFATRAMSSSYATNTSTSSYSAFCNISITNSDTASYLKYSGNPNGTASYALNALASDVSTNSQFLIYTGGNNGTSSYAINARSSSYAVTSSYAVISSYAESASYLIGDYNPIKAWAQVTFSTTGASANEFPELYMNFNISDIRFLNDFTATDKWTQFGVNFINPLPSINYTLIGIGYQPYGSDEPAGIILHPIYSNRTVLGFTMSISTVDASWYAPTTGIYPSNEHSYISFQILGLDN